MICSAARLGLGLCALAFLSNCLLTPPTPPAALKDVQVPAGFTFKTTRPVDLTVSAAASLVPSGWSAALEVARADGKVVYRGPLTSDAPLKIRVPLATKDSTLVARLVGQGDAQKFTLDVAGDTAAHTFQ